MLLGYGPDVWGFPVAAGAALFFYLMGYARGQEKGYVDGYSAARKFDEIKESIERRQRLGFPDRKRSLAERLDRAGAPTSSREPTEDEP